MAADSNASPAVTSEQMKQIGDAVKAVADQVAEQGRQIADLAKPKSGPTPGQVFHAPSARTGEDPLTSRGYSLTRLFGSMTGALPREQAKVECDLHNRLSKYMDGAGYAKAEANSILVPMSTPHMVGTPESFQRETRQLMRAGVEGYDPQEVFQHRVNQWGLERALSWVDETAGGALVGPPVMGELITLLRNNEVLLQSGARHIAMPPSGRAVWPRQTSAMTAYWVGQSSTITDSQPGTGDVTLTAKKLAILAKVPNELFRFPTISFEQFLREDMMRVLALKMDKSMLEAVGSGVEPKGLINYANISKVTATTTGANGDTFEPEDVANMIGTVEEQNADFKAWIMRPLMYSKIANRRADAVTAGDKKGMFLFNMFRDVNHDNMLRKRGTGSLEGYPCQKSTQVSNARVKGGGSNLTYVLGGDFADLIIATAGVIEFIVAREGDTMITQDQTWIRGTYYCDSAVAREASFVLCDQLVVA